MRNKSRRHKQLEILSYRYNLSEEDLTELKRLASGYAGEVEFDHILEEEFRDVAFIHLKDFCFKIGRNGSLTKAESSVDQEIQIDNIIIAGDRMLTFEVKNYNFDLIYVEGQWTYENGRKFGDPMLQVGRQKVALQEFLDKVGFSINLFNTIVFINRNQTIFRLPDKPEILVRSNMLKKLRKVLHSNRYNHSDVVGRLETERLVESQYQADVGVLFEDLKTGVFCRDCGGRLLKRSNYNYDCVQCAKVWPVLMVVKNLVEEMKVLNRTWKISPSKLHKYSGGAISESCILKYKKAGKIDI
ncbi:nuclease-related domain-containing protein [Lacicoccus alkaliphilus]|uniref:Nuclease-related domain-containing protein n=1 Tax=Lacicoccus alkaliphilus DSM 16010 TaxID=1123231 RepID=A0A1M7KGA0_9BACL|nr:nuclease-related domain-containing protein [Salinicoccus alkaliphilus]SHM64302.1 Nuclease-related domain-containing protein [Salinicoccus alkaliphilus DSM 16010]